MNFHRTLKAGLSYKHLLSLRKSLPTRSNNKILILSTVCHSTQNVEFGHKSKYSYFESASYYRKLAFIGAGSVGLVTYLYYNKLKWDVKAKDIPIKPGSRRPDLPNYRRVEIKEKSGSGKEILVTFNEGVYDITQFVDIHPGGKKILLAAGGSLKPFWEMYDVHKKGYVYEMLEELRVGNVHPDDMHDIIPRDSTDAYAHDPERHPALTVNSSKPFNGEPPPELLVDSYLTPRQLFFVRNHLPVPKVDMKDYCLEVSGTGVSKPLSLNIDELKKTYKEHKIIAAVQCAGNRRSNMADYKEVKGLSWGISAIGNAEWVGVKLSDVLASAGVSEDDERVKHIVFQGLDQDPLEHYAYEASIPVETALDPHKDVLLAYKMNGHNLPVDHGFPLRVIVPGVAGARNVKWLKKIIVSKEESNSQWQKRDYKTFNPSKTWKTADFEKAIPIQEYPIQSAICEPVTGSTLDDSDEVTVKGYAWSGGGRGIIRVDVSVDGGKTWHEATLQKAEQRLHREWGWTLFGCSVPIPKEHGEKLEIVCKATDTSHNTQPDTTGGIWNIRGLIHNAWHKVVVNIPRD